MQRNQKTKIALKLRKQILKAKIDRYFSPRQHYLLKTQKSKSGQDPEIFEKLQRLRAVCVAFLVCDSERAAYRRSLDAGRMPHG
jgi:RecA/RadA recombinase